MAERRVLIVEPFLSGSHRAWAEGWRDASRHAIQILGSGEGRWRRGMRAGSVTLAAETETWVEVNGTPDLIVGTNMLDLAGFLGLARRSVGPAPAVQFMHENQLSYPRRAGEALDSGLAWMQWRGLVAADEVWCNSDHHRRALLDGVHTLDPQTGSTVDGRAIEAKTWVAHVGVTVDERRVAVFLGCADGEGAAVCAQRYAGSKFV